MRPDEQAGSGAGAWWLCSVPRRKTMVSGIGSHFVVSVTARVDRTTSCPVIMGRCDATAQTTG